jgi:hypothetical protein
MVIKICISESIVFRRCEMISGCFYGSHIASLPPATIDSRAEREGLAGLEGLGLVLVRRFALSEQIPMDSSAKITGNWQLVCFGIALPFPIESFCCAPGTKGAKFF